MASSVTRRMVVKARGVPANGAVHDVILTKHEAAQYLRVSNRWLETAASEGRIKIYKLSRQLWRVRRSELDRLLEKTASIAGGGGE